MAAHVGPPQLLFGRGGLFVLVHLTPELVRCARLAIGALPAWVDVRAVGSEGGLSARDGEVWVF